MDTDILGTMFITACLFSPKKGKIKRVWISEPILILIVAPGLRHLVTEAAGYQRYRFLYAALPMVGRGLVSYRAATLSLVVRLVRAIVLY